MKLHFARGTGLGNKNFGDALNEYLWTALLGDEFFDDDRETLFIGIGTLLNQRLPRCSKRVVFGSGVGYGDVPSIDGSWKIYCVRGPISAERLGLDRSFAITDPGLLCRHVWTAEAIRARSFSGQSNRSENVITRRFRRSYIPHHADIELNRGAWQQICEELGVHLIDPTLPIETVLSEILATEHLLTEAMHGAIIADAYRVPWTAVRTNGGILGLKWSDWLGGIGLEYRPESILRPMFGIVGGSPVRRIGRAAVEMQMRRLIRRSRPQLSDDAVLQRVEEQLLESIESLKSDRNRGEV